MESDKLTIDELNEISMNMIIHAGTCRDIVTRMLETIENLTKEDVAEKLEQAKNEIVTAHQNQTKVIQSTLEDTQFQPNLLFTHAQDTVMTVYSDLHNAKHLAHIYFLLRK